jgi:hypothetical protein
MINSDREFLNWIYERMICVHGEKDIYDYMINFKSIIDSLKDNAIAPGMTITELIQKLEEQDRMKTELSEVKRFLQELYHSGEIKGVWKIRIERFIK